MRGIHDSLMGVSSLSQEQVTIKQVCSHNFLLLCHETARNPHGKPSGTWDQALVLPALPNCEPNILSSLNIAPSRTETDLDTSFSRGKNLCSDGIYLSNLRVLPRSDSWNKFLSFPKVVVQKQAGQGQHKDTSYTHGWGEHRGRALGTYSTELFSLRTVVKAEVNDDHVVSHALTIPKYLAFC